MRLDKIRINLVRVELTCLVGCVFFLKLVDFSNFVFSIVMEWIYILEFARVKEPRLHSYDFMETPRRFTTAKLSIREPGFSSVLMMLIMNFRAYTLKAL